MDEIRRVEALVRDNPALYQQMAGDIRRIVLRRFPYGLFYAVEDERIFLLPPASQAPLPRRAAGALAPVHVPLSLWRFRRRRNA